MGDFGAALGVMGKRGDGLIELDREAEFLSIGKDGRW